MIIGPTLMEGVKKTNAVVVRRQGMGMPKRNSYTIEVNRGRNCYAYRKFGHIAQHSRNRGQRDKAVEGRKLEYGGRQERNYEHLDNLKGIENLESLN